MNAIILGFASLLFFGGALFEGLVAENYPKAIFDGVIAVVLAVWELTERLEGRS